MKRTMANGGRVVMALTARHGAPLREIFLVGIDDDEKALAGVATKAGSTQSQIIGVLTPGICAQWNLRDGQIMPMHEGAPI
jgi:hypothetical protein